MKLTIKRATADDAPIMGFIHVRTWVERYKDIADPKIVAQMTTERRASQFAQNISNELWEYYLIKLDGTPIGFLVLGESKTEDHISGIGEISALCILSEHQGRGYESRTLDFAIDKLLSYGLSTMYFWVDEGDMNMRTLLNSKEFSFTGFTRSSFIGTTVTHYRYERNPDNINSSDDEEF